MDRVNGADWIDIGGGKRGFRAQNAGLGIPGTELTDVFLNGLQEETAKVIEATGLVLNSADNTQLWQALRRLLWGSRADIAIINWQSAPPVAPIEGDVYVVKSPGSGAWAAQSGKIAMYLNGAWFYVPPVTGLLANFWSNRFILIGWDGAAWSEIFIERLTSDKTFWIRTDGNDANTGLTNTAGAAFQTLTGAYNAIRNRYFANGYTVSFQLGLPGTYVGLDHSTWPGTIRIVGNVAAKASYVLTAPAGTTQPGISRQPLLLEGLTLNAPAGAGGRCLWSFGGQISCNSVDFVSGGSLCNLLFASNGGFIYLRGTCAFEFTCASAFNITDGSVLYLGDAANSFLGISAAGMFVSAAFAVSSGGARVINQNGSFSFAGAATGSRYQASVNGIISVAGGGANFFPGNAVGTVATGGQYV